VFLPLLECGCVTKTLRRRHPDDGRGYLAGFVEGPSAVLAAPTAGPTRFAFAVPEGDAAPPPLACDLAEGRRWTHLRRPARFAFAGQALLDGATPLRAGRAHVEFLRRPGRGLRGTLWRALLTPFAFTADLWLGGRYDDEHGIESWDGRWEPVRSRERPEGP